MSRLASFSLFSLLLFLIHFHLQCNYKLRSAAVNFVPANWAYHRLKKGLGIRYILRHLTTWAGTKRHFVGCELFQYLLIFDFLWTFRARFELILVNVFKLSSFCVAIGLICTVELGWWARNFDERCHLPGRRIPWTNPFSIFIEMQSKLISTCIYCSYRNSQVVRYMWFVWI